MGVKDFFFCEFERLEGEPVRIFTDDERVHEGVVAEAFEHCVRIIDDCMRLNVINYCHIAAIEEPQMRLRHCHHHEEEEHEEEREEEECEECNCCEEEECC